MKLIIITLLNLFCINMLNAQLTLFSQINPEGITEIHLYLDIEFDYEFKDQEIIKAETYVESNIKKLNVMKHIYRQKRYALITKIKNRKMEISMPNLQDYISVNGKPIKDKVHLKLFIPKGIKVVRHIQP